MHSHVVTVADITNAYGFIHLQLMLFVDPLFALSVTLIYNLSARHITDTYICIYNVHIFLMALSSMSLE